MVDYVFERQLSGRSLLPANKTPSYVALTERQRDRGRREGVDAPRDRS